MKQYSMFGLGAAFLICTFNLAAQDCSTEKVNNDCTVTVDRAYPLVLPTIEMRPGTRVSVTVLHRLPFEVLSLDLQSGQAAAASDQTAGFLSAALPNLKGLLVQQQFSAGTIGAVPPPNPEATPPSVADDQATVEKLQKQLESYLDLVRVFDANATIVYDQLNEALGPLPPGFVPEGPRLKNSKVDQSVPRPWVANDYGEWIRWMQCEIGGQSIAGKETQPCPKNLSLPSEAIPCSTTGPPVIGLLNCGAALVADLAPCPKPDQTDDSSDSDTSNQPVACQIASLRQNVQQYVSGDAKEALLAQLQRLDANFGVLNVMGAAIANVDKELGTYYFNLSIANRAGKADPVGIILDPRDEPSHKNISLSKFLGRQVTFSVNAVNEVGAPAASVITSAQKKSVVTITVIFADPIFEASGGAILSTLPNRSFANQTSVTQNKAGSSPTLGNVVITQSVTAPTVVLFAGANWRVSRDFLWPDHRRGAFYFTGTVGLNVNNTNAEFGFGPSISWRSIMFSALYDWGHDVRLTQGEYVGMIWCNQSAANSSGTVPKCSGQPPSPSTEKYWRGVFGFGISVRVSTLFGGGTAASH